MNWDKKELRIALMVVGAILLAGGVLWLTLHKKEETPTESVDAEWLIYCVNSTETQVVSEPFSLESEDTMMQIRTLLAGLRQETKELSNTKAWPTGVSLKEWVLEGNELTLHFDANYSSLTGISEILRRTAIVKTLCQVDGVDYVAFTVGGQPLMDSKGQPIGMMSSDDFIDNTGGETNYHQTVILTLYFAAEGGQTLKQSRHQIVFDGTISLENLVIDQLLHGPLEEEKDFYPTLPAETQVLKISKKDGICYVDFNSAFLNKLPEVSDEVAIYSVVNSLTEISGISKVQFTIDGILQKTYRETIAFDGFFERNLDLVENAQ